MVINNSQYEIAKILLILKYFEGYLLFSVVSSQIPRDVWQYIICNLIKLVKIIN